MRILLKFCEAPVLCLLLVASAGAQIATSTGAAETISRTVTGRVTNAATGAPVARALVQLNSRLLLTDAQGRFSFARFTDQNAFALVTKPGFAAQASADAPRMTQVTSLDVPVELTLYPNALLTGFVSGPDGQPLGHVQVRLMRLSYDPSGSRWMTAGTSQTSERGEYRFDVGAGRYSVSTVYLARSQERGEAVLPVAFPSASSSKTEGYVELHSGEQREINLRPRVGPAYPVDIFLDGSEVTHGVRVVAVGASGVRFRLPARASGQGDASMLTAQLPAGSFQLQVNLEDDDANQQGEGRLNVTGAGKSQVHLHVSPIAVFPVEVTYDTLPATTGVTPAVPNARQFNLVLRNGISAGDGVDQDVRLDQQDGAYRFMVSPGRYRLSGASTGAWFVRSATSGVTDLMSQELVVGSGSAGSPIRVVISNAVGRVKGRVLAEGQPVNSGWVYLVRAEPGLWRYAEVPIQADGSFQYMGPEGQYAAIAVDRQSRESFLDAETTKRFVAQGVSLEILAGNVAGGDLQMNQTGASTR